jgi:mycothiol synthase
MPSGHALPGNGVPRRKCQTRAVFGLRPSAPDDADPVLRLVERRDMQDFGVADFTRGELLANWRASEFDPGVDAVTADDHGTIVGYGALLAPGAIAFVDPAREGEGIGSSLLAWLQARARELGREVHRQIVARRNAAGQALLTGAGYGLVRSVLLMGRVVQPAPSVPPLPEGVTLHTLDAGADAPALHAADDVAFADNTDYRRMSLDAFSEEHLAAPDLDPMLSRVVRRGDAVAAFALCQRRARSTGYIDVLAVSPGERGRGLGRALLLAIFAACADAGLREVNLGVASDNPRALRLYQRAGMIERNRIDVFEKPEPRPRAHGGEAISLSGM